MALCITVFFKFVFLSLSFPKQKNDYSKFLFPFRVILIFLSHVSQINALALSSYNKIVVLYAPLLITTG
ncbi:hypothetical protein T4D_6440 [Trichinella pseudospiralis]|uniref:Uncharacterized protein n=1 Tax=Trichinella pseudospiralis TaxID=6337 RepID=A0A0V1FAE4_TRIPS|nr:hypothetical protein T4D_6440 [Trichinella pseudospiralis]